MSTAARTQSWPSSSRRTTCRKRPRSRQAYIWWTWLAGIYTAHAFAHAHTRCIRLTAAQAYYMLFFLFLALYIMGNVKAPRLSYHVLGAVSRMGRDTGHVVLLLLYYIYKAYTIKVCSERCTQSKIQVLKVIRSLKKVNFNLILKVSTAMLVLILDGSEFHNTEPVFWKLLSP